PGRARGRRGAAVRPARPRHLHPVHAGDRQGRKPDHPLHAARPDDPLPAGGRRPGPAGRRPVHVPVPARHLRHRAGHRDLPVAQQRRPGAGPVRVPRFAPARDRSGPVGGHPGERRLDPGPRAGRPAAVPARPDHRPRRRPDRPIAAVLRRRDLGLLAHADRQPGVLRRPRHADAAGPVRRQPGGEPGGRAAADLVARRGGDGRRHAGRVQPAGRLDAVAVGPPGRRPAARADRPGRRQDARGHRPDGARVLGRAEAAGLPGRAGPNRVGGAARDPDRRRGRRLPLGVPGDERDRNGPDPPAAAPTQV
ncbi:MAG: hypothetical protein AVDCRST_MAG64-60, partial [uncultured Phycisphaerae bacterium]